MDAASAEGEGEGDGGGGPDASLTHVLRRLGLVTEAVDRSLVARQPLWGGDPAGGPAPGGDGGVDGGHAGSEEAGGGLAGAPFLSAVAARRLLRFQPGGSADAHVDAWSALREVEALADLDEAAGARLRLRELERRAGLVALDTTLLLLAVAPSLDRRFEAAFAFLADDLSTPWLPVGPALELAQVPAEAAAVRGRLGRSAPLRQHGLLVLGRTDRPLLSQTLVGPPRVALHLLGDDAPDEALHGVIRSEDPLGTPLPRLPGLQDLAARLVDATGIALHVESRRDPDLEGAIAHVAAAAAEAGRRTVVVDAAAVAASDEPAAAVEALVRELALTGACAVLLEPRALAEVPGGLLARLSSAAAPIACIADGPWDPALGGTPHQVALARPDRRRRHLVLETTLGSPVAEDLDLAVAADVLDLSLPRLARAGAAARAAAAGRPVGVEDLRVAVGNQNGVAIEGLCVRTRPSTGWSGLVLPQRPREALADLIGRGRWRDRVYREWRFAPGDAAHGVVGLFAGPSGTGKTTAAGVVAAELGLDLYTVDLSKVVDKYIGETEKRLDRIFELAEQTSGVLFFDEADALFGKRSEVKDARDRYANLETAYLLQRLEAFSGVALLATNLRSNLDDAFTRRLDVVVDFPLPEPEQRLRLWRLFAAHGAVPLDDDVDLEHCARSFELSGASIRSAVISAAFIAASTEPPICMEDLLLGVRAELRKQGRLATPAEFGPWWDLVAEGAPA